MVEATYLECDVHVFLQTYKGKHKQTLAVIDNYRSGSISPSILHSGRRRTNVSTLILKTVKPKTRLFVWSRFNFPEIRRCCDTDNSCAGNSCWKFH